MHDFQTWADYIDHLRERESRVEDANADLREKLAALKVDRDALRQRCADLEQRVEQLETALRNEIDGCAEDHEFVGQSHECDVCQRLRAALTAPVKESQ